jgi:hypothetical protein
MAQGGAIAYRIVVPGTVIAHADRIARVAVKLSGTVASSNSRYPVLCGDGTARTMRRISPRSDYYIPAATP